MCKRKSEVKEMEKIRLSVSNLGELVPAEMSKLAAHVLYDRVSSACNIGELDDALATLAQVDPVKARLVTLRFFAGLTQKQAAEVLGISTSTADRLWAAARVWLFETVREED